MLWHEGKSVKEIEAMLNVCRNSVNVIFRRYREQELEEYARKMVAVIHCVH